MKMQSACQRISLLLMALGVALTILSNPVLAQTGFAQTVDAINATIRAHHYSPAELAEEAYVTMEARTRALGASAANRDAFLSGFNTLWRDGPFSHVRLQLAHQTVEQMAVYVDEMRVGGGGARLAWSGEVAILTVSTMMGVDTIEEINAAFAEIATRPTSGLIVDLRGNEGGAFAVRALVEHVIVEPLDAGVFASRLWADKSDRAPMQNDVDGLQPWDGWSLRRFWSDTQSVPLTLIRFEPAENTFDGMVYVLTSHNTASAAEMATDALKASGRATLIGEPTAGKMLSQTVFDIPGGFQLWLPIVDYHSLAYGRIEGTGVIPHLETTSGDALKIAIGLIGD